MEPNETISQTTENTSRNALDVGSSGVEPGPEGVEEPLTQSLETDPDTVDASEEFECVCSNCGHMVPRVGDVQCPPCPVCAGRMEAV